MFTITSRKTCIAERREGFCTDKGLLQNEDAYRDFKNYKKYIFRTQIVRKFPIWKSNL
jgi:hypothetical protein